MDSIEEFAGRPWENEMTCPHCGRPVTAFSTDWRGDKIYYKCACKGKSKKEKA